MVVGARGIAPSPPLADQERYWLDTVVRRGNLPHA
jgi:hypothetical protein